MDLRDQVVFITGASSGIGESCARAFARCACRLILAARRGGRLDALAPQLRRLGAPGVLVAPLDTRDGGAVLAFVDGLGAEWRGIEVLVNNAGLSRGLDALYEGHLSDWNEMIDTNIKGLLHVDRAVVPLMLARGRGTVVHVGSVAGRHVYPAGNVYCGTKAAVRAISEMLPRLLPMSSWRSDEIRLRICSSESFDTKRRRSTMKTGIRKMQAQPM